MDNRKLKKLAVALRKNLSKFIKYKLFEIGENGIYL